MADTVKIQGHPVNIGGIVRIMPPLSLGAFERYREQLDDLEAGVADPRQGSLMIDVAHAALQRNYADITRDEVAEGIGLENLQQVMEAVLDIGGAKRLAREAEGKPS